MVVLNAALLSLLLPAAVLARPNQHEKLHMKHKRHDHPYSDVLPSGIHGGPPTNIYPHPTSSSAPYPAGNSTAGAPTGTGTGTGSPGGVVTISSIISIIPLPVSSGQSVPPVSEAGSPTGPSGPGGSGGPEGPGAPGGSGAPGSDVCGPATVIVTSAKTITVTVPAAGAKTSAPAAVQNNSPVQPQPQKEETKPESKPETKPVQEQKETTPEGKPESKPEAKPETNTNSSPVQPQKEATKPETKPQPQAQAESKPVESSAPRYSPTEGKPETQQKNTQPEAESKPSKPSSSPSSQHETPTGGKKGILYKTLEEANAMNGISWGCNWDSSPMPAVGHAQGSLNYEFVPQLWGLEDVHTSIWAANSKGAKYVMAFNEPNQPQGAGGCGPMDANAAVGPYESNFKANKEAGQKIVSPCVSNEADKWLDTFIGATTLKPDAVCFHWYGNNKQELEGVVETFKGIQSKHGIEELWLSEFAINGGLSTSDMSDLLSYLDGCGVNRYAYNAEKMASQSTIKSAYAS